MAHARTEDTFSAAPSAGLVFGGQEEPAACATGTPNRANSWTQMLQRREILVNTRVVLHAGHSNAQVIRKKIEVLGPELLLRSWYC